MTLSDQLRKYVPDIRTGCGDVEIADAVERAADELDRLSAEPDQSALDVAREALQFYSDGSHFALHDPGAWDTVSGEPPNFYEDENNTATVEDGSVAKAALESIAAPVPVQPAPASDNVRAALQELVTCKGLKDMIYQVATTQQQADLHEEYERRKPAAWAAARDALQSPPAAQTDQAKDERAKPFEAFLTEADFHDLHRFMVCREDSDSGGHDVPKDRMRRLTELGVVRSCGFGKHEATAFGCYVHEGVWLQNPQLPLRTISEHNERAAIAVSKEAS